MLKNKSQKNEFANQKAAILELKDFLTKISRENPLKAESLREKRTRRDFDIIKKWILGNKIFDYGCGSGRVGLMIKRRLKKNVVLGDVTHQNETPLPLYLCGRKKTPFADNFFDTVIMLNVLHHTGNACALVKEAARITRRRIVIFEQHLYRKEESRGLSKKRMEGFAYF